MLTIIMAYTNAYQRKQNGQDEDRRTNGHDPVLKQALSFENDFTTEEWIWKRLPTLK